MNGWITKKSLFNALASCTNCHQMELLPDLRGVFFFPPKKQLSTTFDFRANLQDGTTTVDINGPSEVRAEEWHVQIRPKQWLYLWFWTQSYIHFPAPSCLTSHFRKVSYLFELNFLIHK